MARTAKKFYAVRRKDGSGRIFDTWSEAERHIKGVCGVRHKSFKSLDLAKNFLSNSLVSYNPSANALSTMVKKGTIYDSSVKIPNEIPVKTTSKEKVFLIKDTNIKLATSTTPLVNGITAYTDGACSNNGGQGAVGAWGVHWPGGEFDDISARLPTTLSQTNNCAELMAILMALQESIGHEGDVVIFSDSLYSINTLTEWIYSWTDIEARPNGPLMLSIIELLLKRKKHTNGTVYLRKVAAHSGDPGNDMADHLAVEACKFINTKTHITKSKRINKDH